MMDELIPGSGGPEQHPDDPLLASGQASVRAGVSAQTIRNWRRAGMKAEALRDHKGKKIPLWRLSTVLAWKKANSIEGGEGGKRAGAGRPRKGLGRSGLPAEGPLIQAAERAPEEKAAEETKKAGALAALKEELLAGGVEPERILELVVRGVLTKAEADAIDTAVGAMQRRLKYDVERGRYQLTEEVEAVWTECLARVGSRLDGLGRGISLELSGLLGLDEPRRRAVMQAVDRLVGLTRQELVEQAEQDAAAAA